MRETGSLNWAQFLSQWFIRNAWIHWNHRMQWKVCSIQKKTLIISFIFSVCSWERRRWLATTTSSSVIYLNCPPARGILCTKVHSLYLAKQFLCNSLHILLCSTYSSRLCNILHILWCSTNSTKLCNILHILWCSTYSSRLCNILNILWCSFYNSRLCNILHVLWCSTYSSRLCNILHILSCSTYSSRLCNILIFSHVVLLVIDIVLE